MEAVKQFQKKDAELFAAVRKLQQGDNSEVNKVYELSERYIYKIINDIVKNHQTTEDLMQETYIQVYNKLNTLGNPEAFYVWAGRIATNMTLRYIQKNGREVLAEADEDGSTDFVFERASEDNQEAFIPESILDNREKQRLIGEIIDKLSIEQKLSIQYFYYEEMSVSEIAAAMNCSTGTVKSRLNYARKSIKDAVIDLDVNQGTRLYSMAALPVFLLVFRSGVEGLLLGSAAAATGASGVAMGISGAGTASGAGAVTGSGAAVAGSSASGAGAVGAGTAGASGFGATGAAAAGGSTGAGTAAGTAGAKGAAGVISKVIGTTLGKVAVGVVATSVAVTTVTAVTQKPSAPSTPVMTQQEDGIDVQITYYGGAEKFTEDFAVAHLGDGESKDLEFQSAWYPIFEANSDTFTAYWSEEAEKVVAPWAENFLEEYGMDERTGVGISMSGGAGSAGAIIEDYVGRDVRELLPETLELTYGDRQLTIHVQWADLVPSLQYWNSLDEEMKNSIFYQEVTKENGEVWICGTSGYNVTIHGEIDASEDIFGTGATQEPVTDMPDAGNINTDKGHGDSIISETPEFVPRPPKPEEPEQPTQPTQPSEPEQPSEPAQPQSNGNSAYLQDFFSEDTLNNLAGGVASISYEDGTEEEVTADDIRNRDWDSYPYITGVGGLVDNGDGSYSPFFSMR